MDRDLKMGRALASVPLPELSADSTRASASGWSSARRAAGPARRRPRLLRVAVAAAVVAAAAAVVAFAVLPAFRGGPETATAAEMLASMNAAAGNAASCA